MTNGQPKTSAEKRKEYNRRYYASCKENNKISKVGIGDVSQCDSSIHSTQRTPLRILQPSGSQMTQLPKENVSCSLTETRKEYHKRYYAARKENHIPITQTLTNDSTPATTLSSVIDEVMPEISRGIRIQPRTLLPQFSDVISNGIQITQTPIIDRTLTTTLPAVIDEVMSEVSGIQIQPCTPLPQFSDIISNGLQLTQTPTVGSTSTTTLPSVLNEVIPGISQGTQIQPFTQDRNTEEDTYNFVYDGIPRDHRVLKEQSPCTHCGAKRFKFEFATFCCMSGKTMLANSEIPDELYLLLTSQDEIGNMFRQNISAYNTNFSFASMGVTLDDSLNNMRDGVYTFRAHKGIYHKIDQLVSRDGTPRYLQLYFYDPDTELNHRLQWPNLDKSITTMLTRVLSANPYVKTFRSLSELGPLDNYSVSLNASVELDQRVYNRPTTSEVAGIWVEGNDNITSYKRSIVVYGRSERTQTIQPYFGCYDPLSYPLFFPNGESGWHPNIPRQEVSINEVHNNHNNIDEETEEANTRSGRTIVAMREYYCYKFRIRSMENVLLFGGRLLQQFVVDVYIKLETLRLQFCERNQTKIRADLYQGIVDCVNAGEARPSRVGKRIVLPASFIGGPRDMRRRFLDAMTIVQDDGKPDLFLTMTCNPQWPEICDHLKVGQTAQDRPDLVSRVFRSKLENLKE